jgi:hypothetical protein
MCWMLCTPYQSLTSKMSFSSPNSVVIGSKGCVLRVNKLTGKAEHSGYCLICKDGQSSMIHSSASDQRDSHLFGGSLETPHACAEARPYVYDPSRERRTPSSTSTATTTASSASPSATKPAKRKKPRLAKPCPKKLKKRKMEEVKKRLREAEEKAKESDETQH